MSFSLLWFGMINEQLKYDEEQDLLVQKKAKEQEELSKIESMKKFIIDIKQNGEGCDYMIECGSKIVTIMANSIDQAADRFIVMMGPDFDSSDVDWTDDYGGYYDDTALESAVIYEVLSSHKIDTKTVYENAGQVRELHKRLEEEAKELEEYKRLDKKYGKN